MSDKIATKDDWDIEAMPEKTATFILNRSFDPQQMENLRKGNIPQEMEDKWFWYMEGDKLYAHRSWTGICIYTIEFKQDGNHLVTVNRDPDQYECQSEKEDLERIGKLLDWWCRAPYDHYGEWISETADAIRSHEG